MDLIRSLSTLKCSVSIDTAFAIGNKKIRTLSRENIKNIYVSCDSHIAKIHDFQRGQSKETFAAIKVAMNVGLPIAINCTVTAKNAPTIMATYWHFRNMGVKDVTFSIAFIPEGHSLYPSLACERMNKEQKRKLANDLLAIAKQTKDISTERYARLQAICYLDAGWDRMIFDQMKCQMGKNLFVVDQAGRVKMCFHKKDILGQIGDRDSAILNRPQRTVLRNCFGKHCCSLFAIDSFWKPT
jgi:MoaA/NifB/PqqE/SkfB family radical SAM enzyme